MKEYRGIKNHYGIKALIKYTTGMDIPSMIIDCRLNDFQNNSVYYAGYDENIAKKYHGFCTFTVGNGEELIAYYDYYYDNETGELGMNAELYKNDGYLIGKC